MTADGLVRLLAEHYRDEAHVDDLIAMWFEHVCNEPQELDELIEAEQWHWANGG